MVGRRLQLVERQIHRAMRRLVDVDAVDHLRVHESNSPADVRMRGQDRVILLALRFGELLGVVEATEGAGQTRFQPGTREHDGAGDHRPRERATAGLIHARDDGQALLPQLALVGQPVRERGAQCISTSQVPMPLRK